MKITFSHIVLTVLVWILGFVVVEIFRLVIWEKIVEKDNRNCECKEQ